LNKILLIGDSCKDVYHFGKSDRLSPEAPVPIFRETGVEIRDGMSANVKKNLESFGFEVEHLTNKEEIEKHRFIEQTYNQQMFRFDRGEEKPLLPCSSLPELKNYDAIVISDYNKGFITEKLIIELKIKNKKNIPVFVDSKKTNLKIFDNFYVKVNEKEFANAKSIPENNLIVTLGAQGARWENKIYTSEEVEVFDVCGAGDVFLSSFVYGMIFYKNPVKSIMFANRCASLSVTKIGTYCLTKKEINDLCF
jgi:bifunctional ADP-heptose synthase (sugar kinase/adenylyltransferase)